MEASNNIEIILNSNDINKTPNKETPNTFPLFYCVECDKEFNYEKALEHLEKSQNNHTNNSIISEEIINLQEIDMVYNSLKNYEKRKKEIALEKSELDEIFQKMNEFLIYFYRAFDELKKVYQKLWKALNEDVLKNEKYKKNVIQFMNKKYCGLKDKYTKLKDFQEINSKIINTYFSKKSYIKIKDRIQTKSKELYQKFISVFNCCEHNTHIENTFCKYNEDITLKNGLKKLDVREFKILNKKLGERGNYEDFLNYEIFGINLEKNNFLNIKRKRSFNFE